MNILFFGDIVGRNGREVVLDNLFMLKEKYDVDLIIANGENSAHGKGITSKIYGQFISAGIDVITLGNHAFSKSEILTDIDKLERLVCPYNHENKPSEALDYVIINVKGLRVCIFNVLCNFGMNSVNMSPFEAIDKLLADTKNKADIFIVDLHGESTAEKRLVAEYYKDKIQAVLGTHTHVQTADERIIGNLAFISDVGMCGVYDSIIGRDISECINAQVNKEKTHYTIAEGPAQLNAVVIKIDEVERKSIDIKRIFIRPEDSELK